MERDVSDFRWLVEGAASPYLDRVRAAGATSVALVQSLRRELSAPRVHLILEQYELRERARVKFARADEMFFTRQLLEQATDEWIARYKAHRTAGCPCWIDLCCGLGGELVGRGPSGRVLGVDRDPVAVELARANGRVYGVAAKCLAADAARVAVEEADGWHLDPDRRGTGRRVTHGDAFEPGNAVWDALWRRQPHGCIKLAPATELNAAWCERSEREWIGSRRECRQQVVWCGRFAEAAGQHRATLVAQDGSWQSIVAPPDLPAPIGRRLGRYVFDPASVLGAAKLIGAVAATQQLEVLQWEAGYVTGDHRCDCPFLTAFEVLEELPCDLRRLRTALRRREIGQLEIKTRGVDLDPRNLLRDLRLGGPEKRTLLISGPDHQRRAILARRVASQNARLACEPA
ncbi:MAG: hypothetical protein AB7F89_02055 [Pirellulaceae bacterium]